MGLFKGLGTKKYITSPTIVSNGNSKSGKYSFEETDSVL